MMAEMLNVKYPKKRTVCISTRTMSEARLGTAVRFTAYRAVTSRKVKEMTRPYPDNATQVCELAAVADC